MLRCNSLLWCQSRHSAAQPGPMETRHAMRVLQAHIRQMASNPFLGVSLVQRAVMRMREHLNAFGVLSAPSPLPMHPHAPTVQLALSQGGFRMELDRPRAASAPRVFMHRLLHQLRALVVRQEHLRSITGQPHVLSAIGTASLPEDRRFVAQNPKDTARCGRDFPLRLFSSCWCGNFLFNKMQILHRQFYHMRDNLTNRIDG